MTHTSWPCARDLQPIGWFFTQLEGRIAKNPGIGQIVLARDPPIGTAIPPSCGRDRLADAHFEQDLSAAPAMTWHSRTARPAYADALVNSRRRGVSVSAIDLSPSVCDAYLLPSA